MFYTYKHHNPNSKSFRKLLSLLIAYLLSPPTLQVVPKLHALNEGAEFCTGSMIRGLNTKDRVFLRMLLYGYIKPYKAVLS